MKKYFIYTCFAGMMLQACESDLEKAYYSGENSTPAVIEALNQEYVLDKFATDVKAIEFKWTAPDLGYNASISNNIEMDVKGNNFGDKKVTLVSVKDKSTTASLSNKELNDQIETLLKKYDMPIGKTDIEFRISSVISEAIPGVSSNIVGASVIPYDKAGRLAAEINPLNAQYDLKQNDGTFVLNWKEAYMGDNIRVTYSVEMNLEENVFSKRVILGKVVNETSFSIAYDKLNNAFIGLLNSYGKSIDEAKVNFRIICEGSTTEGAISSDIAKTMLIPSFTSFTLTDINDVNLSNGGLLILDWTDVEAIKEPKYNVELAMNGARKTIAYGLNANTVELNHTDLNKDILYMAESLASDMQSPYSVTFRVKASNAEGKMAIYSNEIEANVTTFGITPNEDYREIRGAYNNWGNMIQETGVTMPCQRLYKDGSNYSGMIYITNLYDKWKVRSKDGNTWWGAPNDGNQQTNWSEVQLWTDGVDITGYGQSSYNFSMTETGMLYMSNEEKSWYLSGDFNNWSRPSKRLVLKNDDSKYWLEDEAEMKAGQRWQIISEVRRILVTPIDVEGHFEKYDDSFFTVPEDGTYTIKWYFNEATPYLIVTKKK